MFYHKSLKKSSMYVLTSFEITLFWGIKKDRATGSPLLGLVISYEIA